MVQINEIRFSKGIAIIEFNEEEFLLPLINVKNEREALLYTKKFCRFFNNWRLNKCTPSYDNSYGLYV